MKIDDIELTSVELAIYANAFAVRLARHNVTENSPADAKRLGFYRDQPDHIGARRRAEWAKDAAECTVRWHRDLAVSQDKP